jgi:ribosomal-protein-alanine N-acetyltransferase
MREHDRPAEQPRGRSNRMTNDDDVPLTSMSTLERGRVDEASGRVRPSILSHPGDSPSANPTRGDHTRHQPRSVHPETAIRHANPSDVAEILRVEQAAFNPSDAFSPSQIARMLRNPRAFVFVAVASKPGQASVVGWAAILTRRHRNGLSGRLYSIAIAPEAAGQGLGRRLATHTIDAVEDAGVTRISLEVRADNDRAIALYESLNFRTTERLPGYYADGADGLRMRRPPLNP